MYRDRGFHRFRNSLSEGRRSLCFVNIIMERLDKPTFSSLFFFATTLLNDPL